MFGESFSCGMECPICKEMTDHLIELGSIHFKQEIILFYARCSRCDKISFMLDGKPSVPFLYKCTYQYWADIEPECDAPSKN
jgi:hypothetical protein